MKVKRMVFMPKRSNSQIIYNIDAIEKAIKEGMQISFKYFSLDENKQRVYRKDGAVHTQGRLFYLPESAHLLTTYCSGAIIQLSVENE